MPLPSESGDEATALASVYSLFGIIREILRRRGLRTVQCRLGNYRTGADSPP